MANINSGYLAESVTDLQENADKLKTKLNTDNPITTQLKGKWDVVWGPCICTTESDIKDKQGNLVYVTDNTMYMAQSKSNPNEYFIGIAGTNSVSKIGWFKEDFDVKGVVAWPPSFLDINNSSNAGQGSISAGTSTGLEKLWKMKDENEGTIWSYIQKELAGKEASVDVAGHSLGGALSPTLATALANKMEGLKDFNAIKVSAYPTAGPTPGNALFADHIQQSLSEYVAIYNKVDMVPQAWNKKDLDNVPSFYVGWEALEDFKIGPDNLLITQFLSWAEAQPQAPFEYQRMPLTPADNFKVKTFDGNDRKYEKKDQYITIDKTKLNAITIEFAYNKDVKTINGGHYPHDGVLKGFFAFMMMAGQQHTTAYTASGNNGFKLTDSFNSFFHDNCIHSSVAGAELPLLKSILKQLFKTVAG